MYVESVEPSHMTKIYVLIDPRDNEIRYVGKTTQRWLSDRLSGHRSSARRGDSSWRSRWIAKLLRCGYDPRIILLQEVPTTDWQSAETYWITYLRSIGCRLTNGTDGGEDGPVFTQEVRERRSAAMTGPQNPFYGRTHSPITRLKLSEAKTGTTATPETRAILSIAQKAAINPGRFQPGYEVPIDVRKARSDRMTGVPMEPYVRSKISDALKGRVPVKAQCQRWNINRGKSCTCGQHTTD